MNAKAKFVTKTLLEYGLLGPLFGGVLVIVGLSIQEGVFIGDKVSFLVMLFAYVCGLIPALLTGIYLVVKAVRHDLIHLPTYYGVAVLASLGFNPFFWLDLMPRINGFGRGSFFDENMILTSGIPPISGLIVAFILLKQVRAQVRRTPFALQFYNSTPALSEA